MNSNEIVCFIDMFSIYQKVQYNDGQEEQVSLANLPSFLPQVCSEENISKIHLYGDAIFCNGVNLATKFQIPLPAATATRPSRSA